MLIAKAISLDVDVDIVGCGEHARSDDYARTDSSSTNDTSTENIRQHCRLSICENWLSWTNTETAAATPPTVMQNLLRASAQ